VADNSVTKKVLIAGTCITCLHSATGSYSVDSGHLTSHILVATERGNLVLLLNVKNLGQLIARSTHGSARLGYRKKRMLCCHGADTGFNVTGCESRLTFDWCLTA
jgi:hypothetical protein